MKRYHDSRDNVILRDDALEPLSSEIVVYIQPNDGERKKREEWRVVSRARICPLLYIYRSPSVFLGETVPLPGTFNLITRHPDYFLSFHPLTFDPVHYHSPPPYLTKASTSPTTPKQN